MTRAPHVGLVVGLGAALAALAAAAWPSRAATPPAASPATGPAAVVEADRPAPAVPAQPAAWRTGVEPFLHAHCADCHDADAKKGGLDLTALSPDLSDPRAYAKWVTVFDRVHLGEMPPPKKKEQPDAKERTAFDHALSGALAGADAARATTAGRATQRRLNRYEYENVVRDLLAAPWLQLRDLLPEDGEANRFNKVGEALDVSHVQMARYLAAADSALRQVTAAQVDRPVAKSARYYTREQKSFTGKMKFSVFNTRPERATFPVLGSAPQPDVRAGKAPMTVGDADPETREREATGVVASTYEPLEIKFNSFHAPAAGRYRLRFKTYTVWVGPGKGDKWDIPDLDNVAPGRRNEPVTIYSETDPRLLRKLGSFDATPDPAVVELDAVLLAGETIRPDAVRLFRSRPPAWHNPLAERDGCPGVAFAWMEVEGPIVDQWPPAGHKVLFGDLPLKAAAATTGGDGSTVGGVEVVSANPKADARRLMTAFLGRAYRRPVDPAEVERFLPVVDAALASGGSFADAMTAGYTAVLCSPGFVCVDEKPGMLDAFAVASRLSLFLWNSAPDAALRQLAATGELRKPAVLAAQVDRMLADPRSRRFVDAFLDYWLDLRKINVTAADSTLYPDYYLDDLLTESALEETQRYFAEQLRADLPARTVVASDFAMLNERLADLYKVPGVQGVNVRRVALPPDSVRGGLLTQASVLKVTANGTTTSPVVRGAWVMERVLGLPPPPPPPSVPAVDPDTRGATTIRQQLDLHRNMASCAACHTKIDPAGFALESFDVAGGWRDRYRALDETVNGSGDGSKPKDDKKKDAKSGDAKAAGAAADGKPRPETGIGKNGQRFTFHAGPAVDASGQLPDGRAFKDVRELKQQLLKDERQIARNLARQLTVYATGAPVRFGDRAAVEAILDRAADKQYGVRSLVHAIVGSELFLNK
ncbi:MAG: hypothetical protein JWO31_684 [Phycisphaerales bacterium]|nr:hypothetical protein [Phycisphaerales bacterium]